MYFQLPSWFGFTVLFTVFAAALVWGGGEERASSTVLVANALLTRLLRDQSWPHVQWAEFALDVLLLVALCGMALRSAKYWPLPAAAFALLVTLTHVADMLDRSVIRWAYLTAILIWTYALMITLGIAIWNHRRARLSSADPGAPAI